MAEEYLTDMKIKRGDRIHLLILGLPNVGKAMMFNTW